MRISDPAYLRPPILSGAGLLKQDCHVDHGCLVVGLTCATWLSAHRPCDHGSACEPVPAVSVPAAARLQVRTIRTEENRRERSHCEREREMRMRDSCAAVLAPAYTPLKEKASCLPNKRGSRPPDLTTFSSKAPKALKPADSRSSRSRLIYSVQPPACC